MEKIKKYRFGIRILAYVLIVAAFFGVGFTIGKVNERNLVLKEIQTTQKPQSVLASTHEEVDEETKFQVKIQGTKLYMYEVVDGKIRTIAEHEISEEVYPNDDIEELKIGIDFSSKNEAQSMFENFSS